MVINIDIFMLYIRVSKGDPIFIPILAINRSEAIWGTDAKEFNPDRWASPPEAASNVPGVWGHLMTFLGGPRACIGYRFSLVEYVSLNFPSHPAHSGILQNESSVVHPASSLRV